MKFPTGIEMLDQQVGGVYEGLIILLEEVGAGGKEFAVTSLMKNSDKDLDLRYVSITQTREEVLRDLKIMFPEAEVSRLLEKLNVISLAEIYFRRSIVPIRWIAERRLSVKELKGEEDILTQLANVVEDCSNGIIFLDSLTDLTRLTHDRISWNDLIDLIKGFRKLCIKREILMMLLLTKDVLEKSREEEILDQADGVFVFEWQIEKDIITRWLYFKKFLGILPILEKEGIVKYSARIDPGAGYTITRLLRVI
ncbi:MAG: hypothetical protein B6U95_07025 [Thermofilum sp. ex4484_82]|nr:MAG: hypothetical protein B6U95_07025 [Thermofilum sp. ex4484_82]OYT37296.1 MAG: hypothetical protein B6U96_07020 [Archaeoglobales archaeon ex4484_92]